MTLLPELTLDPGNPLDVAPARRCHWCKATDREATLWVATRDTDPRGPMTRCKNIRECGQRKAALEVKLAEAEEGAWAEDAERASPQPAAKRPRLSRARKAALEAATDSQDVAPVDAAEGPAGPSADQPEPDEAA